MSMRHPFTFSRTGILVICLAASASLRAGQQPAPGTADQPSRAIPLSRTPTQFPRPQLDRQFGSNVPSVPQVREFSPFKTGDRKLPALVRTDAARADTPRVVCGMLIVPGHADLDRRILRPVDPNAPKGIIHTVEPQCESMSVVVTPSGSPQAAPSPAAR